MKLHKQHTCAPMSDTQKCFLTENNVIFKYVCMLFFMCNLNFVISQGTPDFILHNIYKYSTHNLIWMVQQYQIR